MSCPRKIWNNLSCVLWYFENIRFGIEVWYINLKIWNLRRSCRLDSKLSVYAEPKSICQWYFLITKVYSYRSSSSSKLSPGSSSPLNLHKLNYLADYLHGMVRVFADDTFQSFSSNNLAFIGHILATDLEKLKLKEWAKKWLIKFSPLKTE